MLSFKRRTKKSAELPSSLTYQFLSEELGKSWNKMADRGEGLAISSLVGQPRSLNVQFFFAWQGRLNF